MKRIFLALIGFLALSLGPGFRAYSAEIQNMDPPFWWVGMKNTTLQVMLHGPNIAENEVSVKYAGVSVKDVVKTTNPNYLFLYLDVTSKAKPGKMMITLSGKDGKTEHPFELKARSKKPGAQGFTTEDVLYLITPDRFADGNPDNNNLEGARTDRSRSGGRHGGDIKGVVDHLDYIDDLGITAIWLNPVQKNSAGTYHGYAITVYYDIDPRFGTMEEYIDFIDKAHARGMKVVMDMIFNHCGFEHPWVADMPSKDWFNTPEWLFEKNGNGHDPMTGKANGETKSKYMQTSYKLTPVLDPYASKQDLKETVDGWFVPSMPDLNQRNPHLMRYLIQNSEWWIETAGIDGIRMDTYPYADRKAMAGWMKVLDNEYPNFNTVGETWVTEPAYTAAWQKDSKLSTMNSYLKTVMDFSFYDKLNQAKHEETDDWWKGFNRIYNSLCYDYLYADPSHVLAFIENHDTDRFLGNGKDSTALRQALALLLTINRIPQLYYGTEVLMNGTKEVTDGNVRKDFPGGFAGDKHNCFTEQGRTKAENAMFNWTLQLLHWRQGNDVIAKGKQTQFIPWKGVYVIARQYNGKAVMTILNGKRSDNTLEVERYKEIIGSATTARDVITGATVDLTKNIQLSPRQTLIIEFGSTADASAQK